MNTQRSKDENIVQKEQFLPPETAGIYSCHIVTSYIQCDPPILQDGKIGVVSTATCECCDVVFSRQRLFCLLFSMGI